MLAGQDLLLQNLCSSTFINASNFQNLSCIHVGVGTSSHDSNASDHAFVDLYASVADLNEVDARFQVTNRPERKNRRHCKS